MFKMIKTKDGELLVTTTLSDLITGEGADEVIKFLEELIKETTYNIAVTGPQASGKSTLIKTLANLEFDCQPVGWSDMSVEDAIGIDTPVVAVGEVTQDKDYELLASQAGYRRIIAGYHYPNPVRMPRIIECILCNLRTPKGIRAFEVAADLTHFIIKLGFCKGTRVVESITEVICDEGKAYSCRELAYFDFINKKYVVDVPNASKSMEEC